MILKKSLDSHLCDDHLDQSLLLSLEILNQEYLSDSFLNRLDYSSFQPLEVLKYFLSTKVQNVFEKIIRLSPMWWPPESEFTPIIRHPEPGILIWFFLKITWTTVHFGPSRFWNTPHWWRSRMIWVCNSEQNTGHWWKPCLSRLESNSTQTRSLTITHRPRSSKKTLAKVTKFCLLRDYLPMVS